MESAEVSTKNCWLKLSILTLNTFYKESSKLLRTPYLSRGAAGEICTRSVFKNRNINIALPTLWQSGANLQLQLMATGVAKENKTYIKKILRAYFVFHRCPNYSQYFQAFLSFRLHSHSHHLCPWSLKKRPSFPHSAAHSTHREAMASIMRYCVLFCEGMQPLLYIIHAHNVLELVVIS